jgi:hypothetical protein
MFGNATLYHFLIADIPESPADAPGLEEAGWLTRLLCDVAFGRAAEGVVLDLWAERGWDREALEGELYEWACYRRYGNDDRCARAVRAWVAGHLLLEREKGRVGA